MKRLLILMIFAAAAVSCEIYDINEVLLERDDISLTVKGKLQFAYDPLTCQMGYNAQKNEFRVYDDNVGNWFILRCDTMVPDTGNDVRASLSYTGASATKTHNNLIFTVKKRSGAGDIWLWNTSESIGLVVKELK